MTSSAHANIVVALIAMRKEILFAIVLGSIFGVVLAFGIWRFSTSPTTKNSEAGNNEPSSPDTKEVKDGEASLSLSSPQDKSVSSESSVEVSGITDPGNVIVVSTGEDDEIALADKDGSFKAGISLSAGINRVKAIAFNSQGNKKDEQIYVIYSSAGTKSDQTVEDKVNQKIENSTSGLGTITDITDTTVQIRTNSGEVQQVSVDSKTTFAKIIKEQTAVKFSDLAIGDFIAAIGSTNGNEVLKATRILITNPLKESDIEMRLGKVTTFSSKDFLMDGSDGQTSIDATGKIVVTTKSDDGALKTGRLSSLVSEGGSIIVVGAMKDGELVARTIHVL